MQNHNDDTEWYTSHYIWKGCVWGGVGDRTELQHIDPHSINHQRFFPVLLGCSTGSLGPSRSGCWFSLTHLISNWSDPQLVWSPNDWISYAQSYIIVYRPPSCGGHNFALIQPVHCQSYIILIFLDRMNLLFTQLHILFWQPGWVVGQYTTFGRTRGQEGNL